MHSKTTADICTIILGINYIYTQINICNIFCGSDVIKPIDYVNYRGNIHVNIQFYIQSIT